MSDSSPRSRPIRVAADALFAFLVSGGFLLAGAGQAMAHSGEGHIPLSGRAVEVATPAGEPSSARFAFKGDSGLLDVDRLAVALNDPATSVVLAVRGADGASTGPIVLPAQGWAGRSDAAGGLWRYAARGPSIPGGVSKAILKVRSSGLRLSIKAGGDDWPMVLELPQQRLEVFLRVGDETLCATFSTSDGAQVLVDDGQRFRARRAPAPDECGSLCGNGFVEVGETCDDGNTVDDDACSNSCQPCDTGAASYPDTLTALQTLVFDQPAYGCTNDACHGATTQGGLDLRAGASFSSLVNVASTIAPALLRVVPGDEDASLLYRKLAARTLPASDPSLPGSPMPVSGSPLSADHLEALRLWIRGGAPATGVVGGTAELLGTCLGPPDPLDLPAPAPPAIGAGLQFPMPGWPIAPSDETEVCVAFAYDLRGSGLVPPSSIVDCPGFFPGTNEEGEDAGKCFAYSTSTIVQDASAHHLNVYVYAGVHDADDAGWGGWTCRGGAEDGEACAPYTSGACPDGVCGSATSADTSCAAPDFGPADFAGGSMLEFSGVRLLGTALEPLSRTEYPAGVYGVLPLRGIVVWDSHAFNLTQTPMTMNAWLNQLFSTSPQSLVEPLIAADYLYTQDVPPFESREYCATATYEEGTRLFSFRSHYHKRGRHFRIWGPPQAPCGDGGPSPIGIRLATDPACTPGEEASLFYESFAGSDPEHVIADPPFVMSGSVEERTIRYCALYDNGAIDPASVKRASTSPLPYIAGEPGGPCAPEDRRCLGGPARGSACGDDDAACPGSVCDACPVRGGVTSDDEMFGVEIFGYRQ